MAWKPILTSMDLHGQHERATFDAKKAYNEHDDDTRKLEMAKDVAAFASAMGGTLLVGAVEKDGVIQAFSHVDAKRLQETLSKALQALCVPIPSYDNARISLDAEEQSLILGRPASGAVTIVAFNVFPMSSGPVAVRTAPNSDAYRFPIRVGDHTGFLDPARLALYMSPHDRKIALQLHELLMGRAALEAGGSPEGVAVQVFDRGLVEGAPPRPRKFLRLDEASGVAVFADADRPSVVANVPLTFVRAVWRDPVEGPCVAIEGSLFRNVGYRGERTIHFMPPDYAT